MLHSKAGFSLFFLSDSCIGSIFWRGFGAPPPPPLIFEWTKALPLWVSGLYRGHQQCENLLELFFFLKFNMQFQLCSTGEFIHFVTDYYFLCVFVYLALSLLQC